MTNVSNNAIFNKIKGLKKKYDEMILLDHIIKSNLKAVGNGLIKNKDETQKYLTNIQKKYNRIKEELANELNLEKNETN